MNCATCGAENDVGRKFCLECGGRLTVACAACGATNNPAAKFCGECGSSLSRSDAPPTTAPAAPATERRMVSVLFADLVGFTTLSEARDAEDVRALLDSYFDTCRSIVGRYGGTIEKFIGDAVMAVWGTPIAQEDDAERAVRSALDLVEAVTRLGTEREVPGLALRAAVHTGEAVVTIGAAGMGMVAGDLVNTASRLQSVASPGTVLVGDGTRRAAGNAIVFEPAGERELKGKVAPVPSFRAVRVVAQRGGVGRSESLEPPFVGRSSELQLIKDFYHATARDRGPRLVSVIGQAGIGKSRLAWEFLKYIDGVTEIVHWHQGRSPAYGEGISFWALGEMVRMRIGTGEGSDETTTRERVAATLQEYVPDADERRGLEIPLLHLLGIGASESRERGQLFVAWRTFFERIADSGPVVMVFEDLQWADEGLLDFIEELVTWSRGHPIYIITLARPELIDRRPTWGAGQRSFTSLNVAPLADEEVATMLAGLVPGLPDAVLAQIVRRAEGIPLYAVETVRMLLNDGRIERDGDRFRPVGDLSEMAVPESLHALVAARIDGLPAAERMLIQDGSVLGLSFSRAALGAIARSAADEVDSMLQHLLQRELLTIEHDPRSPDRGHYRFVQGLLREVAYSTLSREDRRARHLAAARYYEALGDDELSGVLAQHYVDAYRAHPAGPEGAAVAAQARVALRGAAQRAAELGSYRLAHGYLESALLVATDPGEELELREAARGSASAAGMFDAAAIHARRVIDIAGELGDAGRRRVGSARLADILLEGHQQQALDVLNEALAEPGFGAGDPGYIEIVTVLAKTEMRMQNDARAVELAELALPTAQASGDDVLVLDLLITRGVSLSNVQRSTEATVILTGALEVAKRRSMHDAFSRAATNLGYVLGPDDPAEGMRVSRVGLDEALKTGVVWTIRYLLGNAVSAAIEVGEWDWALDVMAEQDFLAAEPAERLWFGTSRAVIATYRGEDVLDEARELYQESREFDDSQYRTLGSDALLVSSLMRGDTREVVRLATEGLTEGLPGFEGAIHGARAAIWNGDAATAARMREAFTMSTDGRRTRAVLATMDGGIAALEGRRAEARARYADALRIWREIGAAHALGMADLDIVITGSMEPGERLRSAEEARQIFTRLRATALLECLDAALASDAQRPAGGQQEVGEARQVRQEA